MFHGRSTPLKIEARCDETTIVYRWEMVGAGNLSGAGWDDQLQPHDRRFRPAAPDERMAQRWRSQIESSFRARENVWKHGWRALATACGGQQEHLCAVLSPRGSRPMATRVQPHSPKERIWLRRRVEKKNNSRAGYFWLRLLDELNAAYRPPHPSHSPRLWPCMPVSQTLAALNVLRTSLAWARAVAAANRAMLNGAIRDGCSLSRRRASNWAEAAASE